VRDLPEAQQAAARLAGIEDEIVITNEMKICAESNLGITRTSEIASGAKPTMAESVQLVACYNQ
jgi:hypothetical protein